MNILNFILPKLPLLIFVVQLVAIGAGARQYNITVLRYQVKLHVDNVYCYALFHDEMAINRVSIVASCKRVPIGAEFLGRVQASQLETQVALQVGSMPAISSAKVVG